jgi:hypothetical protein
MKLYCFLLVIILVFLVYDNKLYEGGPGDGAYDPSVRDKTGTYKTDELDKEAGRGTFAERFGGEIPFIGKWIPTGDNVEDNTCKDFVNTKDCGIDGATVSHQSLTHQNRNWFMGSHSCPGATDEKVRTCKAPAASYATAMAEGAVVGTFLPGVGTLVGAGLGALAAYEASGRSYDTKEKRNCMNCLKCKDNFAFIEPFYGHLCDAIAVCGDDTGGKAQNAYILSSDPYVYAYNNTTWDLCDKLKDCLPDASVETKQSGSCLNPLQKLTCAALNDNTFLETLLLFKKPESISCYAQIEIQEKENEARRLLPI